jgi:hypothetical protein
MTRERDRKQYRRDLLTPGNRRQRLAYAMLATAVVAIIAAAVTLILRG